MEDYQVVIVGGGVAGLGLAGGSVNKGYKTLLLEKNEVGQAVSNNSLRIMHAGFRYFQQLNLKRVIESIKAEDQLRELFPEVVKPLKCHMKLNSFGLKSKVPLTLAGFAYSALSSIYAKFPNPRPKVIHKEGFGDYSGDYFSWYDSLLLDHTSLVKEFCKDLSAYNNFTMLEYASFVSFKDDNRVLYKKDNQEFEVTTNYLINTGRSEKLNYVKAVNVEISSLYSEMSGFAYDLERRGLYFSVPRNENTVIGTWYFDNLDAELHSNEQEQILSDLKLITGKEEKIISFDLGFLPVKKLENGLPKFYGNPVIFKEGRYIDYNAVKYTTFLVEGKKFINSL